jgi:hypothetical protein
MNSLYLIVFGLIGGVVALFSAAGWSSFQYKKLPDNSTLFRWFVTGILGSGLAGYAWIFGAGGDPSALVEQVGSALEVSEVMETLTSAVGGVAKTAADTAAAAASVGSELTVGMPRF